MKMGVCKDDLAPSLGRADEVFLQPQHIPWQVAEVAEACVQPAHWSAADVDTGGDGGQNRPPGRPYPGDVSNGGFGGIHQKLDKLAQKAAAAE